MNNIQIRQDITAANQWLKRIYRQHSQRSDDPEVKALQKAIRILSKYEFKSVWLGTK